MSGQPVPPLNRSDDWFFFRLNHKLSVPCTCPGSALPAAPAGRCSSLPQVSSEAVIPGPSVFLPQGCLSQDDYSFLSVCVFCSRNGVSFSFPVRMCPAPTPAPQVRGRHFPHRLPVHHRPLLQPGQSRAHRALLADLWVRERAPWPLPVPVKHARPFMAGLLATRTAGAAAKPQQLARQPRTPVAWSGHGEVPACCHPVAFKLRSPARS